MLIHSPLRALRSGTPRIFLAFLILTGLGAFRSFEANFAPKSDLWERWETHSPSSQLLIDASAWDEILSTYVQDDGTGLNRFDYGAVTPADHQKLKSFIAAQSALPIGLYSRAAQYAYWINLYNALTVDVVLDAYPVESIRDIDISPGLFASGPWGKKLVEIEGEQLSLNDIEHRILRPIWADPRVHYAVNCAAVGCPNLQQVAFTADNTEALLDKAAREYINNPRGVSITGNQVQISSIYNWFFEDFGTSGGTSGGTSEQDVLDHIISYAEPGLAERLTTIGELHSTGYDWQLNDQK